MVGIKDFRMPSCCGNCDMRNNVDQCAITYTCIDDDMEKLKDCPLVEAIPKDQYKAKLNTDMIAMLEGLDLQIDGSAAYNLEVAKVQRLIRNRIDKLKEDKE